MAKEYAPLSALSDVWWTGDDAPTIPADAGYIDDECTTDTCSITERHYAHDGLPVTRQEEKS